MIHFVVASNSRQAAEHESCMLVIAFVSTTHCDGGGSKHRRCLHRRWGMSNNTASSQWVLSWMAKLGACRCFLAVCMSTLILT
jgi:hypothetical protein